MKFGVNFLAEDPVEAVELTRYAEKCGFDYATFVDSQLLWTDVYISLALCAVNTSRISLGPGVTNPYTRHPAVTASAICTIDKLSRGRATLGIGRGDSAVRTLGFEPVSLKALREYVDVVRKLTSGQTATYREKPIGLRWAKRRIPIDIAASGPKTLEAAGELGDSVTMLVGAEPSLVQWGISMVGGGAKKAGRKLGEIDLGIYTACFPSKDVSKALHEVRGVAAAAINLYSREKSLQVQRLPREIAEDIDQIKGKYRYAEHLDSEALHARFLTNELIEKFAIVGSAGACIERILKLAELRIGHITFFLLSVKRRKDKEYFMKTFSERILPHVR